MHFLLFNLIPDDAIYDVAGKIIHAKYFLGAKHDFLVFLFADVLFCSSFMLVPSAGVHQYLHHDQLIIIIKKLFFFMLKCDRLVLSKLINIYFFISSCNSLLSQPFIFFNFASD